MCDVCAYTQGAMQNPYVNSAPIRTSAFDPKQCGIPGHGSNTWELAGYNFTDVQAAPRPLLEPTWEWTTRGALSLNSVTDALSRPRVTDNLHGDDTTQPALADTARLLELPWISEWQVWATLMWLSRADLECPLPFGRSALWAYENE
ncbi:hypothetical protein HaLaN_01890 [Haematococcus lacustris]|uniref:Uncharacterized protein n=1 Tax=Haematococcus lacustris TaxID=44745 RepID=A0A699YAF5_HAELA|nr:hypothetical protein HaLaN_01890 [Haematococcus lacustris]